MLDGPELADATIIGRGDVRQVSYGSDSGLYVEFRREDVFMPFKSEQEGRPVYEPVDFIKIFVPGDKTKCVDRPVRREAWGDTPSDVDRFPRQWEAYQRGARALESGIPLAEWPFMTTSQVKALNAVNIYTVEALAAVSDANLDTLGHGGRGLRDKAKAHLERMNDDSVSAKLAASNADLQRQLDELRAQIGGSDAPKRGRPPKSEAA